MTVERIEELRKELITAFQYIPVDKNDKYWDGLIELICYAKEKAEEDEIYVGLSEEERIAWKLKSDRIMVLPNIEPKIEEAYTAEDSLRESQIYIAGFMDCSNSIWQHLQNCLDSIHNQRKAD